MIPVPKSVAAVVAPPTELVRPAAVNTASARRNVRNLTLTQSLCVGGINYQTAQDDEFWTDSFVNYTPNLLTTTPAPSGAIWSSRANGFASDHSRNNAGTDDAYYTDPTRGFGGYNPYSLSGGALNIRAEPVPPAYATAPALLGGHWLSGLLESPALTYGYVEVSAKIPNLRGFWPVPLWLPGLNGADGHGKGYEELDVNELFGDVLPASTVQQTQIFSPAGQPPANFVRTVVGPDPSTAYHTYSVLWTPGSVQFYIDRVARSPVYRNAANGPANAIIDLQVFARNTWGAPPANGTPHTMSLKYYRWYQSRSTGCSPSAVGTGVPTATPTPVKRATPAPTPNPIASGAPRVVQNSGVIAYSSKSTVLGQFSHAPQSGDTLIAFVNAYTPVAPPPGWTRLDVPSNAGYFVFSGIVGRNGLAASKAFRFGSNWGLIQLLEIAGASQKTAILASADPDQWQPQFPRTLKIPKAGGLLLTGWAGYSYLANGFNSIAEQIPSGQTETSLSYSLNNAIGSHGSFSLRIARLSTEPFRAPSPFTVIGTISASQWNFNGDILWISPAD